MLARYLPPSSSCPISDSNQLRCSVARSWCVILPPREVQSDQYAQLSGSPPTTGSVADGQPYYDELVAANNCTGQKDSLNCLRHIPLDAFKATVDKTPNLFSFSSVQNVWRPRVDGDIIVQNPLISVSEGLYAKVISVAR